VFICHETAATHLHGSLAADCIQFSLMSFIFSTHSCLGQIPTGELRAIKQWCRFCVAVSYLQGHGDITWPPLHALVDYHQHGVVKFLILGNHLSTDRQILCLITTNKSCVLFLWSFLPPSYSHNICSAVLSGFHFSLSAWSQEGHMAYKTSLQVMTTAS